jgi:hypothetical protein
VVKCLLPGRGAVGSSGAWLRAHPTPTVVRNRGLSRQGETALGVGGVDVFHRGSGGDAEHAHEVDGVGGVAGFEEFQQHARTRGCDEQVRRIAARSLRILLAWIGADAPIARCRTWPPHTPIRRRPVWPPPGGRCSA